MPKYLATMFCLALVFAQVAFAAPLGTIPDIETQYLRIILDYRSDLWTSPYSYKDSPVRITNNEVRIPVARGNGWSVSANISDESLSLSRTEFSLVDRQIFVGNNLRSVSAGLGVNRLYEDGSAFSVVGAYASASDNPFDNGGQNNWVEGTVTYRSPQFWNYRWLLAVNQSKNRGIANDKLFPYIGILFEPHRDIIVAMGFPFFRVIWQKDQEMRGEARVTPFGATFLLEKNLLENFVYRAQLNYTIRSFLEEDRLNLDDRLYYQEMSFENAFRKELSDFTTVTFGLGYSFNRHLYESRSLYEARENKLDLDSDIYGRIRLEFNLW